MYDTTYLFYGIVKMTAAKLIFILMIDISYMCKLKSGTNWKKTLTIHSTINCIGVTVKLDIAFTIFNKKNGKKMLSDLTKKEMTKIHC